MSRKFIDKPWGSKEEIHTADQSVVHILHIKPGHKTSLHAYTNTEKTWHITQGMASIRIGDENFYLYTGSKIVIPKGTIHRMSNETAFDLRVVETTTTTGEVEVVRYEDEYGRV